MISKKFQLEFDDDDNANDIDEKLNTRVQGHTDIGVFIENFDAVIQMTCKKTFKHLKSPSTTAKGKSVPWWTDSLTIMRRRTNAQRRRYQRTINNDELRESRKNEYIEGKKKYQAAIRKEKINSWKKYCNNTSPGNPWNEAYKQASGKTRKTVTLTTLQKPDGSTTANIKETMKFMLEQLIPEDDARDDTDHHLRIRRLTEKPIETTDDTEFTQDEVRQTIEGFNPRKAPGPDGITSEILTLILNSVPKTLTAIYNECLKKGCFPREWKIARIIPITKPGKEDSLDPSKYRPISLLNIGGKVLEKLLINRIMHHIYRTGFLNDSQFGFTPQKSTIDAAMAVKQYIEPELERGGVVIMASLDVKGAFNAAWWPAILKGLREAKCPRNLYQLTQDYFRERRAEISINSSKREKNITKGCPQGSCCGPGLWNIQYNSLLNLKYTKHTKTVAFADDLLVMIKADSIREAENIANVEMSKITAWAKENKISFNEQKSKVMLMTRRKRKERKDLDIYLNNKTLPQVHILKYLGIIFDSKLTFSEHINYIAEKCTKLIFTLSKSAKLNWGLKHAALKTIYTGGILPLILYGAPVWRKAIDKACYRLKLIRVQRLINIKIAKAYRTVSNEALCILSGMTPIVIKIEEAIQFYDTTRGNTRDGALVDHNVGVKQWQHPAENIHILTQNNNETSTFQIYTDGSKAEQGVGAGVAIFRTGIHIKSLKYKLNKRCTNNQAEQLAILRALEYTRDIKTEDKTATIYTDSRITLDSLKNSNTHTSLIEGIRRRLTELKKADWKIQLCWVKAHVGIKGNELADTIAKEAATSEDIQECYEKVPKSVVLSELRVISVEKWQREWDRTTNGKNTTEFFPEVTERLQMKINITHNFTAMVTGHGNIRSYLHRFKIIETPVCPCGTTDQTIDHLIFECKLLNRERDRLISAILKSDVWPISKDKLIRKHFKIFAKFTNEIAFDKLNEV
jgi:ribonuclease HI